ncbi:MAG TPA: thiamine phosphate synthase [bacterium]|nr:thiamine phosphate synthase [bacterium]HOL49929.1 thiamine phosphate synthase [bacterium]HPO51637.1 thiamine phosphate synthase [bacterium]
MKTSNPLRIIDANFNRVREALRVVEDILRFSNAGKNTISDIRKIKHDLCTQYFKTFGYRALATRDITADPGRKHAPYRADTLTQILTRNFMRAEEGLRCIEECSRIVNPESTDTWQAIRFKIYAIEQQIVTNTPEQTIPHNFSGVYTNTEVALKIMTDISPDILILNVEENMKTDLKLLKKIKRSSGKTMIFVANRPDIALIANIDGIHLDPDSFAPEDARKIVPGKIIGLAMHDMVLQKFYDAGISYIAFYSCVDISRLLTKHKKNIKLLLAAIVNSRQEAKKAIEKGADGVIVKNDIPQEIIETTGLIKELYGKET